MILQRLFWFAPWVDHYRRHVELRVVAQVFERPPVSRSLIGDAEELGIIDVLLPVNEPSPPCVPDRDGAFADFDGFFPAASAGGIRFRINSSYPPAEAFVGAEYGD